MKNADRTKIMKSVQDLIASVTSLIDTIADESSQAVSKAAASVKPGKAGKAAKGRRGGARGKWTPARRAKLKKSIASYWSKLTPEQHAARVKKMLAGRGLKPTRGAAKAQ